MAPKAEEVEAMLSDLSSISPIPYYPGYESLWIVDETSARVEANDRNIVNPLTVGAEAYYTYSIADSVSFTLQSGREDHAARDRGSAAPAEVEPCRRLLLVRRERSSREMRVPAVRAARRLARWLPRRTMGRTRSRRS